MRDSAVGRGLRLTQDNEGYYGYNEGIGAYVEVISYNKLLKNARQRNQVLFDKHLGVRHQRGQTSVKLGKFHTEA